MSSPSSRTRQIGYCGHSSSNKTFLPPSQQNILFMALGVVLRHWKPCSRWSGFCLFERSSFHDVVIYSEPQNLNWFPGGMSEVQRLTKSCCLDLWKRYADRSIWKCKQISIIALFATRLLLRSMDDYIPQLKIYFLNRCFATVQNENLRLTGTPPIPKPITMLFPSVPHLTPVPPLSLLHPNSSPVYTPVVSSPVQFKKPSHSTQSCSFLHPRQDFWTQLQSMWWHLRVPYVEPCWGGIPCCQTRWTESAEGLMEWMK